MPCRVTLHPTLTSLSHPTLSHHILLTTIMYSLLSTLCCLLSAVCLLCVSVSVSVHEARARPPINRCVSDVSALTTTGASTCPSFTSTSSFRTKYEPQRSIHSDIQDVFLRPRRQLKSRGHEIPEPAFRLPSSAGGGSSVVSRAVSRGSTRGDTVSRNNANVQVREVVYNPGTVCS